jgi:hypothetical protein
MSQLNITKNIFQLSKLLGVFLFLRIIIGGNMDHYMERLGRKCMGGMRVGGMRVGGMRVSGRRRNMELYVVDRNVAGCLPAMGWGVTDAKADVASGIVQRI